MADEGNVIRGHKAAINNPRVSEEAKEHSREVIEDLQGSGGSGDRRASVSGGDQSSTGGKDPGNVARGLKASINNPNVSEAAKERAEEKLDQIQS